MKVVQVATEMYPLLKLGGLGDVIGSLPAELVKLGVNVQVVLPFYYSMDLSSVSLVKTNEKVEFQFDGELQTVRVFKVVVNGVSVVLLDNGKFIGNYIKVAFAGDQPEVNHYAFFSRAVSMWLVKHAQDIDLVQLHDWHVGLVPWLFHHQVAKAQRNQPKFLFTIHNLGYHGFSDLSLVDRLGISNVKKLSDDPSFDFDARGDHQLDLLLQGLLSADFLSTVSPTYAEEIQRPEYCEGLCSVLQKRSSRLVGILNGIDTQDWNPSTDTKIVQTYTRNTVKEGKASNKRQLLDQLGLEVNESAPLIGFVGRLDPKQKGLQLIDEFLPVIIGHQARPTFILLGVGDPVWEDNFVQLAESYRDQINVQIAYDERLAHQIYAASDIMLIPSAYEPCGLVQMIAMRYGAIPIVHAVGGLKDTVKDGETGFCFEKYSVRELIDCTNRAFSCYRKKQEWNNLVARVMGVDFSWTTSAKKYQELYEHILRLMR